MVGCDACKHPSAIAEKQVYTEKIAYLRFRGCGLIIAVGSGSQGSSQTLARANTPSLRQVFLALGFPNLDLLLLAPTAEFLRLKGILRLELGPAMLGDVSISHGYW